MIVHGFVDRATQDIDLFTEIDDAEARRVSAALRTALLDRGLHIRDADRPPADHRFVAIDPADRTECLVEVFADGGRLQPRVILDIGPALHPDDLAADKVLALWGRARPRDFYDVRALMRHYSAADLLDLAAAKDAGFTTPTFVDALNAIARLTDQDWTEDGIDAESVPEIQLTFAEWRDCLLTNG